MRVGLEPCIWLQVLEPYHYMQHKSQRDLEPSIGVCNSLNFLIGHRLSQTFCNHSSNKIRTVLLAVVQHTFELPTTKYWSGIVSLAATQVTVRILAISLSAALIKCRSWIVSLAAAHATGPITNYFIGCNTSQVLVLNSFIGCDAYHLANRKPYRWLQHKSSVGIE